MSTPKTYLGLGDIAGAEGVDVATVSKWRDRYDDFPPPDIRLGKKGQWPGWDEARLPEVAAWRRNRITTGGRPRHVTVDEAHVIGLPLAEWVAAGKSPQERTRRLMGVHNGVQAHSDEFLRLLESQARVLVDNTHVRTVLAKPQGNRAGDYARGLIHTAMLEHLANFRPPIEFGPHRFPPDLLEDPKVAIAATDEIELHAPDDEGARWVASRTPTGWVARRYVQGRQRHVDRHSTDDALLTVVQQRLGEGWIP